MLRHLQSSQTITNPSFERSKAAYEQFLQRKDVGFVFLPQRKHLADAAQKWGEILRQSYQHMVIVGIGGSSLGSRVIKDLYQGTSHTQLHFCDNVDPMAFKKLVNQLPLKQTCWLLVSKTGSTVESLVIADFVAQIYSQQKLSFSDHAIVVSENRDNPLTLWARERSRPTIEIPVDVGGRFSVLTPVGLLPAAFLGASVNPFLAGAEQALQKSTLIVDTMARTLDSWEREEFVTMFWSYSSQLRNFGGWIQQLWAESLAKSVNRQGHAGPRVSTPLPATGACDQHSILQQVMEGHRDQYVIFQRVEELENDKETYKATQFSSQEFFVGKSMGQLLGASAEATSRALTQSSVSNTSLMIQDLKEQSIGELFMFWQLVVAGLGEALDINAFNQPGVELGKRLAREILQSK